MVTVSSPEELNDALLLNPIVLIFFDREECEVCGHFLRRVTRLLRSYEKIVSYYVSLDDHPTQASRFGVYKLPAVVVYANGKMTIKFIDDTDLSTLKAHIHRLYHTIFSE
jgi:thioredoxin-like negative regulator of GroEL